MLNGMVAFLDCSHFCFVEFLLLQSILYTRESKQKSSSICKHYLSEHNSVVPPFISEQFHVLTKGSNKFDCLIKEMLFIRKLKPSLNVQANSIRAKVFT